MDTSSLLNLGNCAFSRGNYAQALFYYQKAMEGVKGDPVQLSDLYGNIGNVHAVTGQFEEALSYYQKALKILRREEDYARLGSSFVNIGNIYADQGKSDQAIHFYKQGDLLLEQEDQFNDLAILYGNLSLLSLQKNDRESALAYAEKGVTYARRMNRPPRLADATHRLAKAKEALGDIQAAHRLSQSAYALYHQLNDEMGMAATLFHQSHLYEKEGDLSNTVRCLKEVVAIDEKHHLPKLAENRARLARLQNKIDSKESLTGRMDLPEK